MAAIVFSVSVQQGEQVEVKPFRLQPGKQIRVGRNPQCDIVVEHPQCSNYHAEIRFEAVNGRAPRLCVRDTSSNGTGVQNRSSTSTRDVGKDRDLPLEDGMLIFMPYRLKVKTTDPSHRTWLWVTNQSSAPPAFAEASVPKPGAKRRATPEGAAFATAVAAAKAAASSASRAEPPRHDAAGRKTEPPGPPTDSEDNAESNRKQQPHAASSTPSHTLRPDMRVQLVALKASPGLNGTGGVLQQYDEDQQRWNVLLDGGDVKAVRPANLLPANSSKQARHSSEPKPRASGRGASSDEDRDDDGEDQRQAQPKREAPEGKRPSALRSRDRERSPSRSRSRSGRRRVKSPSPLRRVQLRSQQQVSSSQGGSSAAREHPGPRAWRSLPSTNDYGGWQSGRRRQ